jgi:hypothetical protein
LHSPKVDIVPNAAQTTAVKDPSLRQHSVHKFKQAGPAAQLIRSSELSRVCLIDRDSFRRCAGARLLRSLPSSNFLQELSGHYRFLAAGGRIFGLPRFLRSPPSSKSPSILPSGSQMLELPCLSLSLVPRAFVVDRGDLFGRASQIWAPGQQTSWTKRLDQATWIHVPGFVLASSWFFLPGSKVEVFDSAGVGSVWRGPLVM